MDPEMMFDRLWNLRCALYDIDGGIVKATGETYEAMMNAFDLVNDLLDCCGIEIEEGKGKE